MTTTPEKFATMLNEWLGSHLTEQDAIALLNIDPAYDAYVSDKLNQRMIIDELDLSRVEQIKRKRKALLAQYARGQLPGGHDDSS
jgi:hypothetical protein